MKSKQIALAVGAVMLTGAASAEFSANIGATSDYLFRGQSLTDHEAAISGGLDYAHDSGFYVGTWASSLGGGTAEVDLYAGYGGAFGDLGYDISIIRYMYPSASDFDYTEIVGSVSYAWFEAGIGYTVDSEVSKPDVFVDDDLYYYVGASYEVMPTWTLGGTIGYYDFDSDGDTTADGDVVESYTHFQLDVTKSGGDFGDLTFTMAMNDGGFYEGSSDEDDVMVAVSWAKTF